MDQSEYSWAQLEVKELEEYMEMIARGNSGFALSFPLPRAMCKFFVAMGTKILKKYRQGFSGWDKKENFYHLKAELIKRITGYLDDSDDSDDLVDIANFAMFLYYHSETHKD
ncbi:MAG: hypothetical protein PHW73_10395 [Atribacterota bacterium]|nr:hypothetical protein [Atribacterota bacterium]